MDKKQKGESHVNAKTISNPRSERAGILFFKNLSYFYKNILKLKAGFDIILKGHYTPK